VRGWVRLLGLLSFGAFAAASGAEEKAVRREQVSQLHLDDVYAAASPERTVELSLRALTAGGAPVVGLGAKDFLVRQDDLRIDPAEVEVTPLGDAKRGVACVIALDLSPTMADSLAEVQAAAASFLDRLGSYDRVAVVTFSGKVEVAADFTAARADARRIIDALQIHREPVPTRVYDGIHRAVELIRSGKGLPRRSFVILFSDGSDGGSEHSLDKVVALAKGAVGEPRVLVFTIGYATGFGDTGLAALEQIAKETTADFVRADSAAPLTEFYGAVWAQMMKSYVLRFRTRLDGEPHQLEVVADGQAKDARAGRYPEVGGELWPWIVGALVFVGVLGGSTIVLALSRRAGRLVFQSGPSRGKNVVLRRGLNRIGQISENDVVLASDAVSRRHAEIEVQGRNVQIRDLDSTNGTFVNDKRLERESPLRPGDRIRIADVELVYER
jgi:hypothetical protein